MINRPDKNLIREERKIYKYIEEVSDYKKQLELYNLYRNWDELTSKFNNFEYYNDVAQLTVFTINKKLGEDRASYKPALDMKKRQGYRIYIKKPNLDEFINILDKDGKLLPSRGEQLELDM